MSDEVSHLSIFLRLTFTLLLRGDGKHFSYMERIDLASVSTPSAKALIGRI